MSASNQYRGINHPIESLDSRFASSNLPLREQKAGTTRVVYACHWLFIVPGRIKPDSTSNALVTGTDFYPTLLEMIGMPTLPNQHVDGVSFLPALLGKAHDRGAIYWHFPHYSNHGYQSPGGRYGLYKLLEYYENGNVQLFDLEKDIGEQNDLSKAKPDVKAKLLKMLHEWRREVDAKMPYPKTANSKPAKGSRIYQYQAWQ